MLKDVITDLNKLHDKCSATFGENHQLVLMIHNMQIKVNALIAINENDPTPEQKETIHLGIIAVFNDFGEFTDAYRKQVQAAAG